MGLTPWEGWTWLSHPIPEVFVLVTGHTHQSVAQSGLDSSLLSIINLGTLFSLSGVYLPTSGENSQPWLHFHSPLPAPGT